MRPLAQKTDSEKATELTENTSPVCYLESAELRPEYRIDKETSKPKTTKPNSEK